LKIGYFGVDRLLETLEVWDGLIAGRGKVHLIACGGTGLTLLGIKDTTKDVDLLVPEEKEYKKLIAFLTNAGYKRASTCSPDAEGLGFKSS